MPAPSSNHKKPLKYCTDMKIKCYQEEHTHCINSPTCSCTIVVIGKASIWSPDAGGGPAPSSWFNSYAVTTTCVTFLPHSMYVTTLFQISQSVTSYYQVYIQTRQPDSKKLTNFADRAFRCTAPTVWNSLNIYTVDSGSLAVFKSRLKTFLFRRTFNPV